MKQLLAWTGSADSTITSEAAMAMAEKFNTGQEVCLQIPSARGVMQVKEGTSGLFATWRACPLRSQAVMATQRTTLPTLCATRSCPPPRQISSAGSGPLGCEFRWGRGATY
jgi:hypothetical protein